MLRKTKAASTPMMTLTAVLLPCVGGGVPATGAGGETTLPVIGNVDEATVVPQFEQNFAPSDSGAPQFTQNAAMTRLRNEGESYEALYPRSRIVLVHRA
jgi:hypothetical protein